MSLLNLLIFFFLAPKISFPFCLLNDRDTTIQIGLLQHLDRHSAGMHAEEKKKCNDPLRTST